MESALAYSEVYEIINLIGEEYKNKIPTELLQMIDEERDKEYKPNINTKRPLKEQNIHQRTYDILGMLQLNYWCNDENEKKELIKKFKENDKKREKEIYEKYNPDNIFKKNNTNEEHKQVKELIKYEESPLKKFLNKILRFFHIKIEK